MRTVRSLVAEMRPRQWTKNLIVIAPAIFAGRILVPDDAVRVAAALAVFCIVSGAVYILNDVHDAQADRAHPIKRLRPVASGRLAPRVAVSAAAVLLAVSLGVAYALSAGLAVAVVAYGALQLAYTWHLKRVPFLDVAAITVGFLLRALGGAAVIGVGHSPWLLACALLLVVFLALGKRRQETAELGEGAPVHRPALARYDVRSLDAALWAVSVAACAAYLVYTVLVAKPGPLMVVSVPFVAAGLFRYLFLVFHGERRSAEELLLSDPPLMASIALWLGAVMLVVYRAG